MRVLLSWVGQRDPRWGEAFYHEGPVLTFLNEYLAEGYPPFDHIALFFTPGDAPVPGASDKLSFGQRADRLRQEIGSRQAHAPSATASSAVETYMVELDEPHLFVAVQATLPPRVRHVLETLRRECAVRTLIADASIVLGLAGARGSRGTRLVDAIAAATTRLEQSPKDEEARDRLNSLLNAWYPPLREGPRRPSAEAATPGG
ncbi:MAG: hypothetical protein KatS3mg060_2871 [Dehalococcoidia bacterium]|nr:MAG: hypothetical protein KatS3mg060_2871 [Dehalococcoidia bacterium]